MRRGFWNGLVAGTVLGTMIGMLLLPQQKPPEVKARDTKGQPIKKRVRRVAKKVSEGVNTLLQK